MKLVTYQKADFASQLQTRDYAELNLIFEFMDEIVNHLNSERQESSGTQPSHVLQLKQYDIIPQELYVLQYWCMLLKSQGIDPKCVNEHTELSFPSSGYRLLNELFILNKYKYFVQSVKGFCNHDSGRDFADIRGRLTSLSDSIVTNWSNFQHRRGEPNQSPDTFSSIIDHLTRLGYTTTISEAKLRPVLNLLVDTELHASVPGLITLLLSQIIFIITEVSRSLLSGYAFWNAQPNADTLSSLDPYKATRQFRDLFLSFVHHEAWIQHRANLIDVLNNYPDKILSLEEDCQVRLQQNQLAKWANRLCHCNYKQIDLLNLPLYFIRNFPLGSDLFNATVGRQYDVISPVEVTDLLFNYLSIRLIEAYRSNTIDQFSEDSLFPDLPPADLLSAEEKLQIRHDRKLPAWTKPSPSTPLSPLQQQEQQQERLIVEYTQMLFHSFAAHFQGVTIDQMDLIVDFALSRHDDVPRLFTDDQSFVWSELKKVNRGTGVIPVTYRDVTFNQQKVLNLVKASAYIGLTSLDHDSFIDVITRCNPYSIDYGNYHRNKFGDPSCLIRYQQLLITARDKVLS